MHSKADTWTIARQIAFFEPADGRGKWHAAHKVSHTAVCGSTAPLGAENVIRTAQGEDSAKAHPFLCRRCLRLATMPGYSAQGIEQ